MFFLLIRTSNLEAENDSYPVKLRKDVVIGRLYTLRPRALTFALSHKAGEGTHFELWNLKRGER